jgi:hypothetical protein
MTCTPSVIGATAVSTRPTELRVSKITTVGLGIVRRGAGHHLREAERGLHGDAGLRRRRLGQLPGAVHVGASGRLHHARRGAGGFVGLVAR